MSINYCFHCGSTIDFRRPDGDDRPRYMCPACGNIHYQNPRMVVGCIPEWADGRILLCRRNIEPRKGFWTLPAGYLENGESVAQGAERETLEEADVAVDIIAPYRLFDLAFVNQMYLMFRARLKDISFKPTMESIEVALFEETDIPWRKMAFQVIEKTLQCFFRDRAKGTFEFKNSVLDFPRFPRRWRIDPLD